MTPNPSDRDERACRDVDPEVFFPEASDITGARLVVTTYCARCPVMDLCLEWALEVEGTTGHSGRSGIYGGKNPSQRWAIYNERRKREPRPQQPINHGTAGGYKTHLRRGEKACVPCTEAANLYKQQRVEARRRRAA